MSVQDIFNAVIHYDPLPNFNRRDHTIPPLSAWLRENPDSWRSPRETETQSAPGTGQLVVLFTGEEGAGKTTQLNYEVDRRISSADQLIIRIDFSNAAALMGATASNFDSHFGTYLRRQVEASAIGDYSLYYEYHAAKARVLIRSRAHYTLNDAKRLYAQTIDDLSDDDALNIDVISRAVHAYETQNQNSDDGVLAIEAVQDIRGKRTVFVIDNVDHLAEPTVGRVFAVLSGAIQKDTLTFIGIRSENAQAATVFRHQRPVETITLHNDGAIARVLRTRADGALRYVVLRHPNELDQAREIHAVLVRAMDLIASDVFCANLLESWQNGSIRQMLHFVYGAARGLRDTSDERSVRGTIFSELIQKNAQRELLEVFDSNHVGSRRVAFVFLRLRLLAYMLKSPNGLRTISDVRRDFSTHFGIDSAVVDSAIEGLASRTMNSGALVRRTAPVSGSSDSIVLLPAGRIFITSIVYSCEFLAWVYDNSTSLPPVRTGGHHPAEIKLGKAVVVVNNKLLPAFSKEHPYLAHKRVASNAERVRLASYKALFGYGPGCWFIKRLSEELANYARERSITSTELSEVTSRIAQMVRRLDQIFNDEDSDHSSSRSPQPILSP